MVVKHLVDIALDTTYRKDGKYHTDFSTIRLIRKRAYRMNDDEVGRLREKLLYEGLHSLVWLCGLE